MPLKTNRPRIHWKSLSGLRQANCLLVAVASLATLVPSASGQSLEVVAEQRDGANINRPRISPNGDHVIFHYE